MWLIALDDPVKARRRELAHLAQDALLGAYLGVPPEALEFERNDAGKPRLRGEPLQFNLSHSEQLALLAVTAATVVGVDVQAPHRAVSREWFANRICTSREREHLGRLPDTTTLPQELLRLWVRKEAVIKARGAGSYVAVGEIDVLDDGVAGGWLCRDLRLSEQPAYRAAVAIAFNNERSEPPELSLRRFTWT